MIQSQVTILNSLFHSFYFTYSQEVVGILRFSPGYNVSNVSRCSRTKMPSPITFLPTRARRYASTAESSFRVRQTWTSMSERTTSSALTWSRRRTNFLEIKPLDKSVTISSKKTHRKCEGSHNYGAEDYSFGIFLSHLVLKTSVILINAIHFCKSEG